MPSPLAASKDSNFLPALTAATRIIHQQQDTIYTRDFTAVCDRILTALDKLGFVFQFARADLESKNVSLKKAASTLPTLADIVANDRAAGKLTVKNSCARNLHRLMHVVTFLRIILEQLIANPDMTLKDAVWHSYELSLSPIHTYVVRTAVWAGLCSLPLRTTFLASVGETEESARETGAEFVMTALALTQRIEGLFGADLVAYEATWLA